MRCATIYLILLAAMISACEPEPEMGAEASEAACYDEFDNDEDGAADCADSGCADLQACCVGAADSTCCLPTSSLFERNFADCTAATVDKCAPETRIIGAPELLSDGLAPTGPTGETGLYFTRPLDPRGANYRILFEGARAASCEGCLNYVHVGLTSRRPESSDFRVYYDVSLVLLPAFGTLEVRSPWDATILSVPIDAEFHRYAMDLRTDGTMTVSEVNEAGVSLRTLVSNVSIVLNDPAYLAISGQRDALPPGVTPSRVRAVSVERGRCDRPQNVHVESAPLIPSASTPELPSTTDIEGVGRAVNAAGAGLALIDIGDAFHWYELRDGAYRAVAPVGTPALALT